jgi:uncharacterized protein YjiS (DUF1127 family)
MTEVNMKTTSSFGLSTVWYKIKTAWLKHRLFAKTRDELESCNNRELADMGINRCEIPRIARDHADKAEANDNLKGWV